MIATTKIEEERGVKACITANPTALTAAGNYFKLCGPVVRIKKSNVRKDALVKREGGDRKDDG